MMARFQEVQRSLQKRRAELSAAKSTPPAVQPPRTAAPDQSPMGQGRDTASHFSGARTLAAAALSPTPMNVVASATVTENADQAVGHGSTNGVNRGSGQVSARMTAGAVPARGGVRHSAMAGVLRRLRAEEPAATH